MDTEERFFLKLRLSLKSRAEREIPIITKLLGGTQIFEDKALI